MLYDFFKSIGEDYAAGLVEFPDRGNFYKYANAHKKYLESVRMPSYNGGALYPCNDGGWSTCTIRPNFSFTIGGMSDEFKKKYPSESEALLPYTENIAEKIIDSKHSVAGCGYTHSFPNYKRIVKEGLNSYKERILKLDDGDFKDGLLLLLDGIEAYRRHAVEYLESVNAPKELIEALNHVPFNPARNFYEGLVSHNFIFYIDGCDNPGSVEKSLYHLFDGKDYTQLIVQYYKNVDCRGGWSSTIGPRYTPLALQALKACKGLRRPSIELRLTNDMPEEFWEVAVDCLKSGSTNPAFYNENVYMEELHRLFPQIPQEDLYMFTGGGCTETMIEGMSNVGSLDAGINLALIFSDCMREMLDQCDSFEALYSCYIEKTREIIKRVLSQVSEYQKQREKLRPNPMRSLLIDDCIDNGRDYNAKGGAKYAWSIINLAGFVNVIDSFLTVKKYVFDEKKYSAADFIAKLDASDPELKSDIKHSPCLGNDDDSVNKFTRQITSEIYAMFEDETPYLGGRFLPSSIQFMSYVGAGKEIPATPDGRECGSPLCDSIGAENGKDISGPTARLNSAAAFAQRKAIGTTVMNIRLSKDTIEKSLKGLVYGYFDNGGIQLQISCLSKADMLDALEHPEKHEGLIVRVGGYSEYFNRLSPELKKIIIERTEF